MRWAIYILALIIASCTSTPKSQNPIIDTCYTPQYATGFEIGYDSEGRKVLWITDPCQGLSHFEQGLYLLTPEQSAPKGANAIVAPATKLSVLSSSHAAMLDAIGMAEAVVGASGVRYYTNNTIRTCATEIGYDTALDYERIKAIGTQVMLLYSVYGVDNPAMNTLSQRGIPYIYIGDYAEPTPLGKAEWIVAIAALCGREQEAIEIFNGIAERYNALKASAANYTVRPKVMLNTPYRDSWFMPAVESYAVQLIADAGAEYIYSQNKSHQSTPISLEQALLLASAADVWINVGNIASLAQFKSENPRFATIPAVTSGRVYNNTKRTNNAGGSDFWESGALNADIVLDDMIKLLHHNAPTDSLHYYKRLE